MIYIYLSLDGPCCQWCSPLHIENIYIVCWGGLRPRTNWPIYPPTPTLAPGAPRRRPLPTGQFLPLPADPPPGPPTMPTDRPRGTSPAPGPPGMMPPGLAPRASGSAARLARPPPFNHPLRPPERPTPPPAPTGTPCPLPHPPSVGPEAPPAVPSPRG